MTLVHRTGWDEALEAAAAHVRAACRHRRWADSSFCNACDDVADTIEETPYLTPKPEASYPSPRLVEMWRNARANVLQDARALDAGFSPFVRHITGATKPEPVVALGKRTK